MGHLDDDQAHALATLARGLQGALERLEDSGVDHLPRPSLAAVGARAAGPPSAIPPSNGRPPPPPAPPASARPPPAGPAPPPPRPPPVPAAVAPLAVAPTGVLAAILDSGATNADKLERLRLEVIGDCTRCKLHRGRSRLVFGVGNPNASLVFVGEGPGADEDRQGVPFVGKAGQLLTRMIEAMSFTRDDVYICNVVKCRPPSNRDPEPDEVEACEPFLQAQLAILRPRAIVALGRHAAQTLLRTKTPITRLRGTWQEYRGVPLMPTYHPSYLLREEVDASKKRKREAWSDLQEVMKLFGKARAP